MDIIFNNKNLAPFFLNKNNLLKTENTKKISYKNLISNNLNRLNIYDKYLYLFINKNTNKLSQLKLEGVPATKSISKIEIENKINNINNNSVLSKYGNGKIKFINKASLLTNSKVKIQNQAPLVKEINTYIKSISVFNIDLSKYQNIVYHFNKNNKNSSISVNNNIFNILESSFFSMSSLISKPFIVITPNKVIIQLFFYINKLYFNSISKSTFLSLNKNKLQILCLYLSKIYKKPVELELDRLYYPYFDSHILVNMLGLISNIVKFRFIIRKLFNLAKIKNTYNLNRKNRSSIIPSFLAGIKIRIAGRLLTQRVIPRLTVKTVQRGTLARGKTIPLGLFVNAARFTNKNKRGAFSITVTTGHIFY
jgi:hypothetical protein